jgi:hypothetical protein
MFEPRAMKVRGAWAWASLGTCPRLILVLTGAAEEDAVTPKAVEADGAADSARFDMPG